MTLAEPPKPSWSGVLYFGRVDEVLSSGLRRVVSCLAVECGFEGTGGKKELRGLSHELRLPE